ncbi:hypothetical protein C8J28_1481 [Cereibacter azotoformans]|uniref:Uncharacterized protein n=1 Tax=Cereibacter azotoformans TaxID=43057 RepID=A0A2T5JK30_9RHOB|nr:hypothetical protein C8J28_1481 [Cereibacter azotoformans]
MSAHDPRQRHSPYQPFHADPAGYLCFALSRRHPCDRAPLRGQAVAARHPSWCERSRSCRCPRPDPTAPSPPKGEASITSRIAASRSVPPATPRGPRRMPPAMRARAFRADGVDLDNGFRTPTGGREGSLGLHDLRRGQISDGLQQGIEQAGWRGMLHRASPAGAGQPILAVLGETKARQHDLLTFPIRSTGSNDPLARPASKPPLGQRATRLQLVDPRVEKLVGHGDLADLRLQAGDLVVALEPPGFQRVPRTEPVGTST